MASDDGVAEIVVCLGSSCFARGNSENLAVINEYMKTHELSASIQLTGKLCQDLCKQGPNVSIAGECYHGVTAAKLRELLDQIGKPPGGDLEAV